MEWWGKEEGKTQTQKSWGRCTGLSGEIIASQKLSVLLYTERQDVYVHTHRWITEAGYGTQLFLVGEQTSCCKWGGVFWAFSVYTIKFCTWTRICYFSELSYLGWGGGSFATPHLPQPEAVVLDMASSRQQHTFTWGFTHSRISIPPHPPTQHQCLIVYLFGVGNLMLQGPPRCFSLNPYSGKEPTLLWTIRGHNMACILPPHK